MEDSITYEDLVKSIAENEAKEYFWRTKGACIIISIGLAIFFITLGISFIYHKKNKKINIKLSNIFLKIGVVVCGIGLGPIISYLYDNRHEFRKKIFSKISSILSPIRPVGIFFGIILIISAVIIVLFVVHGVDKMERFSEDEKSTIISSLRSLALSLFILGLIIFIIFII